MQDRKERGPEHHKSIDPYEDSLFVAASLVLLDVLADVLAVLLEMLFDAYLCCGVWMSSLQLTCFQVVALSI